MNSTFTIPQLAAAVRRGQPGAVGDFLENLSPHMRRMLRRALSGRGRSLLDAKLRQAASAALGNFEQLVQALCRGSAARLEPDPATASPHQASQLAADWTADTVIV